MQILGHKPELVKCHSLPGKEVRILPLGDIQYSDGQTTDIDGLKKCVRWGMDQDCYFIGMGDYIDVASPSNRAAVTHLRASAYDSVRRMLDSAASGVLEELEDILKPTVGRWLGLIVGHHVWEFEDGTTSDSRLAEFLCAPLAGHCAGMVLRLENRPWSTAIRAKIWAHHGAGGGQRAAAPLNRLELLSGGFNGAHVYLMGHQHKRAAVPIPSIDFDIDPETEKPYTVGGTRYLVATGSWLKGYEMGTTNLRGLPAGSYVEQKMLPPVTLGAPLVKIRPVRDPDPRVDISVEI